MTNKCKQTCNFSSQVNSNLWMKGFSTSGRTRERSRCNFTRDIFVVFSRAATSSDLHSSYYHRKTKSVWEKRFSFVQRTKRNLIIGSDSYPNSNGFLASITHAYKILNIQTLNNRARLEHVRGLGARFNLNTPRDFFCFLFVFLFIYFVCVPYMKAPNGQKKKKKKNHSYCGAVYNVGICDQTLKRNLVSRASQSQCDWVSDNKFVHITRLYFVYDITLGYVSELLKCSYITHI